MKKIFVLLLVINMQASFSQKFDQLALTPPMGWNSWNTFATNINEQLIKDVADKFISLGLKDAGYNYVVLDDGWMAKERDSQGNIVADPKKFPGGMKALADYVHSKGLKFGVYSCGGALTCGGYPGGRGHEYQDALMYASWGVDYLKYDWCNTDKLNAQGAYTTMRDALYAAKRPVVFSICEWGDNQPWLWGKEIGHLWRISGDISPCWDCEEDHGIWSSWGVMRIVHMRRNIRQYAGPGHWNDFDMMEVGNGMTLQEDRAHFALWCMLASPLMLGNDLSKAKPETIEILSNKEVIAVNQDKLGIQAFKYLDKDGLEIWAKPLQNNEWALCFLNRKDIPLTVDFDWKKHQIKDTVFHHELPTNLNFTLRDLYKKQDIGSTEKPMKATLSSHDVLVLRLRRKD